MKMRLTETTRPTPKGDKPVFGRWRLLVALMAITLVSVPAYSETKPSRAEPAQVSAQRIGLELNKLVPQPGGQCRVFLVVSNRSSFAFDVLQLDLVTFDPDGLVGERLVVEAGPLPAGKSGLRLFDIPSTECDSISRILLNTVPACSARGDEAPENPGACLALIDPSSKSDVELAQ